MCIRDRLRPIGFRSATGCCLRWQGCRGDQHIIRSRCCIGHDGGLAFSEIRGQPELRVSGERVDYTVALVLLLRSSPGTAWLLSKGSPTAVATGPVLEEASPVRVPAAACGRIGCCELRQLSMTLAIICATGNACTQPAGSLNLCVPSGPWEEALALPTVDGVGELSARC